VAVVVVRADRAEAKARAPVPDNTLLMCRVAKAPVDAAHLPKAGLARFPPPQRRRSACQVGLLFQPVCRIDLKDKLK
jgi:hypothetical protein